jgi:hypothetical protein
VKILALVELLVRAAQSLPAASVHAMLARLMNASQPHLAEDTTGGNSDRLLKRGRYEDAPVEQVGAVPQRRRTSIRDATRIADPLADCRFVVLAAATHRALYGKRSVECRRRSARVLRREADRKVSRGSERRTGRAVQK